MWDGIYRKSSPPTVSNLRCPKSFPSPLAQFPPPQPPIRSPCPPGTPGRGSLPVTISRGDDKQHILRLPRSANGPVLIAPAEECAVGTAPLGRPCTSRPPAGKVDGGHHASPSCGKVAALVSRRDPGRVRPCQGRRGLAGTFTAQRRQRLLQHLGEEHLHRLPQLFTDPPGTLYVAASLIWHSVAGDFRHVSWYPVVEA